MNEKFELLKGGVIAFVNVLIHSLGTAIVVKCNNHSGLKLQVGIYCQ